MPCHVTIDAISPFVHTISSASQSFTKPSVLQHIDTAEMYKNETEIGKGLHELFKSGAIKREEVFVTSKLWTEHHPADQVRPGLMDSLSRLQLDYLDLYLIHWYSLCTPGNQLLVLRHVSLCHCCLHLTIPAVTGVVRTSLEVLSIQMHHEQRGLHVSTKLAVRLDHMWYGGKCCYCLSC